MKSSVPGKATSKAEIQDISKYGIWIYVAGKEFFLPYEKYPWFKDGTVKEICNLEFSFGHHLHWPDLDIDLTLDSLEHPEKYPLMAKYEPRQTKHKSKQKAA